ncbi:MAG TPA: hypothetical protein VKT82_25605 [Ktedonobacterales bacterium]|nr:hypothetical protein [Ktedonobacterales bacterium]
MNYPPQQSHQGLPENPGIAGQNGEPPGYGVPQPPPRKPHKPRISAKRRSLYFASAMTVLLLVVLLSSLLAVIVDPQTFQFLTSTSVQRTLPPTLMPSPTPTPFDPNVGAVLPTHRVVAFYGVPFAEPTGPAYELNSSMLEHLQNQGAAYQQLDPTHPVQLGIDLVVSVPDNFPGPEGYYSHHVDPATIQSYIDFCQQHGLILFLDLNIGQAPIMKEVDFFLPYLERYSFVEMAVDPEWMFPRHDGIPGINLSNVRASDLNPIIEAVAAIPEQYHVPRKILMIHQYRSDGDGLANPYDPGQAEIADKRDLVYDPRVDVVIHIDGVGGYVGDQADKTYEYTTWVAQDIQKYHNFRYGGFKLFYHIEAKTLMTPQQVLALTPPPLVVTYGN